MGKSMKILCLLLTAVMLFSLVACNGGNERETESATGTDHLGNGLESETGTDISKIPEYGDYVEQYADTAAMQAWLKENIEDTDTPPVYFEYGNTDSDKLKWTKTVGEPVTVTDYAESDHPVQRTYKEIKYVCADEQLEVTLILTSYPKYPVIEYDAHLKNLSGDNSKLVKEFSCVNTSVADASQKTILHYNRGSSSDYEDYAPYTAVIDADHSLRLAIESGQPTQEYLPYFNLEDIANKTGVITAVNWQGNWFADYSQKSGKLVLQAGQNQAEFNMLGNEEFEIPGLVLIFYKNGDWQYGQNIWRRWIIEHNLMRNTGRRDYTENVFLCSGFEGFDKNYSSILNYMQTKIGYRFNCTYELDAGWYECGGNWQNWYNTGNWDVASNYPGDSLKKMSDAAKEANVGFCLWMEPERFVAGSPEAVALGPENYIEVEGNNFLLINYGKKEAQDYVVNLVDSTVKKHGLSVYRQDFNTWNIGYWLMGDYLEVNKYGIKRYGVTENHACEGYINAWTRISELNPGLIFDSCAGGGRRNDLDTIRFSFAHTKSDYWSDITSQQNQNFASLSWLIFTGTGFANPSSQYDVRSRITLSIGIGGDVDPATLDALKQWHENHEYMYNDYYQLSPFNFTSGRLAMQFHDHENGEGMMIVYLRQGGEYALIAKGLQPDVKYKVYDKDHPERFAVMTGAQLMTDGFYVQRDEKVPSAVIALYEVTDKELTDYVKYDNTIAEKGDVIVNFDTLVNNTNDDELLFSLAKNAAVTDKGVQFIAADHDSSGGIYAIGKGVYANLIKTGSITSDGWEKLDPSRTYIYLDDTYGAYALSSWPEGGTFDIRGYVKEQDGVCLLWLDNTFSFGDPDGGWKNTKKRIGASKTVDGTYSDEFDFKVCAFDELGGRAIQFAAYDGRGDAAYRIDNSLAEHIVLTDKKVEIGGIEWQEVDTTNIAFKIAYDDNSHNIDNNAMYIVHSANSIKQNYKVNFYIGEKDGQKYLLIEDYANLSETYRSDRWMILAAKDDILYSTEIYMLTGVQRDSVAVPETIVNIFG